MSTKLIPANQPHTNIYELTPGTTLLLVYDENYIRKSTAVKLAKFLDDRGHITAVIASVDKDALKLFEVQS